MARVIFAAYLYILHCAVAVQFNTGDVKLDGDSSGLLGIYLSGNWGTVSHVNFSKGTADVVCHQLGYSGALNFSVANGTLIGKPVWLAGPNCIGNELHVLRCKWDESPCNTCHHQNDISVQCNSTRIWDNPYEGYVHLNGASQSNGQLLVYLKGQWGAVCADNFTKAEADSVCRQLGYTESNGHQSMGVSGGIWLKNFDCSESEPCFTDCYDYPVNSFWITDCLSGPVDVSCDYNISADWSPGTDCWYQSPSNSSLTTASSTPTQTLVSSAQPNIPSTTVPSLTTASSTMEWSIPTTLTATFALTSSAIVASSHIAISTVPVATTSVLPPSNLPALSKGAIVGIAVGLAACLLAVIALVTFCICCAKCGGRRGYTPVLS